MTPFDFLWPVTVDGKHAGDIRFQGSVHPNWSWLTKEKYMSVDYDSITWVTKHTTADMTDTINLFGWPESMYFPDERLVHELISEKYYTPAYAPEEATEPDNLFRDLGISLNPQP